MYTQRRLLVVPSYHSGGKTSGRTVAAHGLMTDIVRLITGYSREVLVSETTQCCVMLIKHRCSVTRRSWVFCHDGLEATETKGSGLPDMPLQFKFDQRWPDLELSLPFRQMERIMNECSMRYVTLGVKGLRQSILQPIYARKLKKKSSTFVKREENKKLIS